MVWGLESNLVGLLRPSDRAIAAQLAQGGQQDFSYPEVGATAELGFTPESNPALPPSIAAVYDVDHREFKLGIGRPLFERARAALVDWRHFEIPWLEFHGAEAPVEPGQVVATLVSVAGLWFLNPCRVVFSELSGDPNRAAFAYGTLPGHAERGEERFAVRFDPQSDEVLYIITAFSRPASIFSKLGYPLARRLQKRFAVSSAEALARAAA